jgi:hypothetical protein
MQSGMAGKKKWHGKLEFKWTIEWMSFIMMDLQRSGLFSSPPPKSCIADSEFIVCGLSDHCEMDAYLCVIFVKWMFVYV